MNPNTEKNVNEFINSWRYAGGCMKCLFGMAISLPFIILFVAFFFGAIWKLFFNGELEAFVLIAGCLLMAVVFVLAVFDDDIEKYRAQKRLENEEIQDLEPEKKKDAMDDFGKI